MRTEEFTMERDVLNVGDIVPITEGTLPRAYYYPAEPAAELSGNFAAQHRIVSSKGKVAAKRREGSSFIVSIEFEE